MGELGECVAISWSPLLFLLCFRAGKAGNLPTTLSILLHTLTLVSPYRFALGRDLLSLVEAHISSLQQMSPRRCADDADGAGDPPAAKRPRASAPRNTYPRRRAVTACQLCRMRKVLRILYVSDTEWLIRRPVQM